MREFDTISPGGPPAGAFAFSTLGQIMSQPERAQTVFPKWAVNLIGVLLGGGFLVLLAGKLLVGNDRSANRPFVLSLLAVHAVAVGLFLTLLFRSPKIRPSE
jgi:hypothetical protein